MNDAELTALWTEITRTARPGARVIFRTAADERLLPGRVPDDVLDAWRYEDELSRELGRRDRSSIYGAFHLYTLERRARRMSDAAALMDRMYRRQRHIYDLTRKFYLLGRDEVIARLRRRARRHGARDRLRHRAQSRQAGASLSRGAALRPRRVAGNAGDRGGGDRRAPGSPPASRSPRRTRQRSIPQALFGCASSSAS